MAVHIGHDSKSTHPNGSTTLQHFAGAATDSGPAESAQPAPVGVPVLGPVGVPVLGTPLPGN